MTKSSLRIIGIALITTFALAAGPTPAHAQSQLLKAQIPFAFYVDGKEFPPGEYRVERYIDGKMVQLSDGAGHRLVTFVITAVRQPESSAKLIFNKYGDEYFLSELRWAQSTVALQFLPSPRERELAKKITPQQIATKDKRS